MGLHPLSLEALVRSLQTFWAISFSTPAGLQQLFCRSQWVATRLLGLLTLGAYIRGPSSQSRLCRFIQCSPAAHWLFGGMPRLGMHNSARDKKGQTFRLQWLTGSKHGMSCAIFRLSSSPNSCGDKSKHRPWKCRQLVRHCLESLWHLFCQSPVARLPGLARLRT